MKLLKHDNSTPRWIIFTLDLALVMTGFLIATLLRFNFHVPTSEFDNFWKAAPFVALAFILIFRILRSYSGIIRHTDNEEISRVVLALGITTAIIYLGNWGYYYFFEPKLYIPQSVIVIQFFVNSFLLLGFRFSVRWLYLRITNPIRGKKAVIIYGAGQSGLITKRTLDRDIESKMRVVGFLDDNPKLIGKKLGGIRIYDPQELDALIAKHRLSSLIISIQNLDLKSKEQVIDSALAAGVEVMNVPPVKRWIQGKLSANQIRNIRIEDLLGRSSIQLDQAAMGDFFKEKVILITGAAGSIGSEIVRQVLSFNPRRIVMLDQAESPIYDLQQELNLHANASILEPVLANICDGPRMERVFSHFKPDMVFHAAAYKHVPLMENNPAEAIRVNALGTKILADLSIQHGVRRFVMISSDKAVNPTNVMGATKRAAEMYVQTLQNTSSTAFITTRFGNVLGSNGSVIPLFKKQIENGGPVLVTHPEITRFFMTIPEACSLVLEAATMGQGGEIYVFDMGQSIRIYDLAKRMIDLSGLRLGKDIEIQFSGLREGEKLYEELLNDAETTLPTHHAKIMIAQVALPDLEVPLSQTFEELQTALQQQDNETLVRLIKSFIPEYKSNNSVFEKLD